MCSPPGPDPAARHEYLLANRCNSYFRWLFEGIRLLYGLSDYIMFAITQVAEELDLPIQWHTGLGIIDDTRAIGLRKLLQSFPNVKFDIGVAIPGQVKKALGPY